VTADGSDNYVPLRSLSWQVHVYGQPQEGLESACVELGLPLHVFEWRSDMRRHGFRPGALYLIRPDGYVAVADTRSNEFRLRRYLTELRAEADRPRVARGVGCLVG
jgi:hypothetical protein